jgi:hypothetical protein
MIKLTDILNEARVVPQGMNDKQKIIDDIWEFNEYFLYSLTGAPTVKDWIKSYGYDEFTSLSAFLQDEWNYEDENLDEAAQRVLCELTGLSNIYLEQVYTFGDPNRISKKHDQEWLRSIRAHPEARVITVAYTSLINKERFNLTPSSFARNAVWVKVKDVPQLGFDHNEILEKALDHLKHKIYLEPLGYELLPDRFTLAQLQKLYEAILVDKFDKRNFRRKILRTSFIVPLHEKQKGVSHKPARLYRFDKKLFHRM